MASVEVDSAEERSHVEQDRLSGDRQGTRVGLVVSGVLCVIAIWTFVALRPQERSNLVHGCMREHAGFIDISPGCSEPVSIERQGDILLAYAGAHLEDRGEGLRIREGKVSFVARKRGDGARMRVLVSHGAIDVVGTRFTVTQGDERGSVRVEEGHIAFHWTDGEMSTVAAGDTLEWPRRPPPPRETPVTLDPIPLDVPAVAVAAPPTRTPPQPRPQASKPPASRAPEPPSDEEPAPDAPDESGPMLMEDVLKKASTLRSQQRYSEALELLRAQLERVDFTGLQQARLSFEIGMLLYDRIGDKAGACAHWKLHARKYPDDASHADRVQEFIRVCDEPQ